MFILCSILAKMQIASALRRKRDEIAATIAAHEARIDAARMDLAALDQAARLFDSEAERAETIVAWDLDRLTRPEDLLEAPCEAGEGEREPAMGQSALLIPRTQDPGPQALAKVAHTAIEAPRDPIPGEFFYFSWP